MRTKCFLSAKSALLVTLIVVFVAGVGWASWSLLFKSHGSGGSASEATATLSAYADAMRSNDAARTYELLSAGARASMSLDDWTKFNLAPAPGSQRITSVDVGTVRLASSTEAYGEAVIHLSDGHRLPVTLRLVREQGKWRIDVGPPPRALNTWITLAPEAGAR